MARECAACGGEVPAYAVDPDFCDEVCARAWRYTTQTDAATASPAEEVHRWNRVAIAAHQAEKGGVILPEDVPEGWSVAMLHELAELRDALRGMADVALLGAQVIEGLEVVVASCCGPDCEHLFQAHVVAGERAPSVVVFRGQMTRLRERIEAHWADQHRPVAWGSAGPRKLGAELDDLAAHLVAAQSSRG